MKKCVWIVLLMVALGSAACGEEKTVEKPKPASSDTLAAWKSVKAAEVAPAVQAALREAYPEWVRSEASGELGVFFRGWSLAPDGEKAVVVVTVAAANGLERHMCLFVPTGSRITCYADTLAGSALEPFLERNAAWSPDSHYLAYTNEWSRDGQDPDIYVLDTQNGTLQNLTDDGFSGTFLGEENPAIHLDFAPFWSPDSRRLFFLRANATDLAALYLYALNLDGGEPEPVADFAPHFPETALPYAAAHVAPSPDGTQVAILTTTFRDNIIDLWKVDLRSGAVEKWFGDTQWRALIPAFFPDEGLWGRDLLWSADGKTVLVSIDSDRRGGEAVAFEEIPPLVYGIIDVPTNRLRSLIDLSGLSSLEDYQAQGAYWAFSPQDVLLAADGRRLVYLNIHSRDGATDIVTVWAVPTTLDEPAVSFGVLELPRDIANNGSYGRALHQISARDDVWLLAAEESDTAPVQLQFEE